MTSDNAATRRDTSRFAAHRLNGFLISQASTYQLRRALDYYKHLEAPEAAVICLWLGAELDTRAADVAAKRSARSERTNMRPLH